MRSWIPWLGVLALILVLNMLRLRTLATIIVIGWLIYCVWTWIRPGTASRGGDRRG